MPANQKIIFFPKVNRSHAAITFFQDKRKLERTVEKLELEANAG